MSSRHDSGQRGPRPDAGPGHPLVPPCSRDLAHPRTHLRRPHRHRRTGRGGRLRPRRPACRPRSPRLQGGVRRGIARAVRSQPRRRTARADAVPRSRRHRRPDGPYLGDAARLRPHRPAGLPAGVRAALLGGPGRPSADRGGIRRAHGTGRARRPRLRHRAQRRVGTVRTIVDVGGGTGAMLASLLRRHPQARGILVDLPGTVARAGEIIDELRGGRPGDGRRAELLRSAARRSRPVPAEERPQRLARRADRGHPPPLRRGRRLPSGQRTTIAVLGGVSADETPRSLGIDMLVAGGKTSTLTQFTELARQAGLEVVAARTQSSGRFVVECRSPVRAEPRRDHKTRKKGQP